MKKHTITSTCVDAQKEFKRFLKLHQLKTLEEVRKIPTDKLLKMEGFGYRQLIEVVLNKDIVVV